MSALDNGLGATIGNARKFGSGAICRMCAREKKIRPLTRHHLVPRAFFAELEQSDPRRAFVNATANLIPLCRPCHDLVDNRDEFERTFARRKLRQLLGQAEIAFVIALLGKRWLDEHYPLDRTLVAL